MYETEGELNEAYDEMLNECCTEWATPNHTASYVMEQLDPIMYRCGFSDWVDSIYDNISEELKEEMGL